MTTLRSEIEHCKPLIDTAIHQLKAGVAPDDVWEEFMEACPPGQPEEWDLRASLFCVVTDLA